MDNFQEKVAFIWSVADLLRGDYKQSEYGKVILPLTVLRRLDSVLEPTKQKVLKRHEDLQGRLENVDPVLMQITGHGFYNTSQFTFPKLLDDPTNVGENLRRYILGFDTGTKDVVAKFELEAQIRRLERSNLLYKVVSKFCDIDLHPDKVSNLEMGYVYEELIRRFSELSNETAGEHFTPREVIRLMVNILFANDRDLLTKRGAIATLYDPACGTGGMLSVAEDHLRDLNPGARLRVYGQELNAETYAVCRSDMMLKGQDASSIYFGNSFSEDGLPDSTFDYLLANPPFGVEWKKVEEPVREEHEKQGYKGRFGAGLPRINDGSLLFLQHMLSKMKPPEKGGSRLAIVFNASPLFTGGAGSGESEIRRWIIENDWLEAIVGLPEQLFYNTGISTYFWVLTNRKSPERRGKIQLVDARELWTKMRRSLGEKRKTMSDEQIVRDHAPVLGVPRGRALQDLPERGLRLPADHCGTAPPCSVGGERRDAGYGSGIEGRREAGRGRARAAALGGRGPERDVDRRAGRLRREDPRRAGWRRESGEAGREGSAGRRVGPRPRGAHRDGQEGSSRARSRPARLRERAALEGGGRVREARGSAVRPRRLGRRLEDEDRL